MAAIVREQELPVIRREISKTPLFWSGCWRGFHFGQRDGEFDGDGLAFAVLNREDRSLAGSGEDDGALQILLFGGRSFRRRYFAANVRPDHDRRASRSLGALGVDRGECGNGNRGEREKEDAV
jgi:hypothetical protein